MRRRRRGEEELFADINIIPFTDVCLVLLIIFMITANFIATGQGLNIELPAAASALPETQSQVIVFVTAEGDVYLNARPVTPDGLSARLADAAREDPEMVVVISADRTVPYEHVVDVLDAVRGAGVSYLALAAEQEVAQP
ncbi:MAG: biopolymer transporter ExbD [Armatimonadota bacterium]|nr:biopolymer transporter ExbD [Armatimonadota bacterium]